jgi:hypothetical protein
MNAGRLRTVMRRRAKLRWRPSRRAGGVGSSLRISNYRRRAECAPRSQRASPKHKLICSPERRGCLKGCQVARARDWHGAAHLKGESNEPAIGNPGGSPEATRRAFNKRFLLDLAEDWQQHGRDVFKRVRRESPASYLKVCAMLVPKEMKVEHSAAAYIKDLTDEQLEACIATLKEIIERKDNEATKVIEGEAEVVPSLPAPASGGAKPPKS